MYKKVVTERSKNTDPCYPGNFSADSRVIIADVKNKLKH
jgi:hypothetical protein